MTDNPITPPPELVKQWGDDILNDRENVDVVLDCAWKDGYRAGARAARRPKPRSLAEEALMTLEQTVILLMPVTGRKKIERFDLIRRALERLQELEGGND